MTEPLDARSEREIARILESVGFNVHNDAGEIIGGSVRCRDAMRELFVRVREQACGAICYGCAAKIPYKEGAHEPIDGGKWFECRAGEIRSMELKGE